MLIPFQNGIEKFNCRVDHLVEPNLLVQKAVRGTFDHFNLGRNSKVTHTLSEFRRPSALVIRLSCDEQARRVVFVQVFEWGSQSICLRAFLLGTTHELFPDQALFRHLTGTLGQKVGLSSHRNGGLNAATVGWVTAFPLELVNPVRGGQQGGQVPAGRQPDRPDLI